MTRYLAALTLLAACAAFAESPQERLARTGVLRFTEVFPAPAALHDRHQEIDGVSRIVLAAPPTLPAAELPVDAEGGASLDWSTAPALDAHASGWWVESAYAVRGYQVEQRKRRGYQFVARADAQGALALRPVGTPTDRVRARLREAWSAARRLESPEIIVPEGARLQFATGLQSDWRADRESGAVFRLLALHGENSDTLFEETLHVWREQFDGAAWHEHAIDLAALAGSSVRFVFETAPAPGTPEPSLAFPLWGAPALLAAPAQTPPRDSLILVSLDTLRADHIGAYGHPRPTTPKLDAFAQESLLFKEARAPASMTTPSHASLFTGLSPALHRAGIFSEGYVLEPRWSTFVTPLREAGHLTAAFTEGVALRGGLGFYQGFDYYSDGPGPDEPRTQVAEQRFDDAAAWVEKNARHPFVLFVHTYEIHAPYDPPAEWVQRFADPAYDGPPVNIAEDAKGDAQRRHIRDRYDAGIAYTDEHFGRFIERCRASGALDRAHVIVFSDHGEEFWEHEGAGHAKTLYREQLHVPLVIRPAGGLEAPQRVAAPVQLSDVYSTVLDLCGLAAPRPADSLSLAPFLGLPGKAYDRLKFFAYYKGVRDSSLTPEGYPLEWDMIALEEAGKKRYLHGVTPPGPPAAATLPAQPTENGLYNVQTDPFEHDNLREAHPEETAAMDRAMLEWLTRELEARKAAAGAEDRSLSSEDADALRALGYL